MVKESPSPALIREYEEIEDKFAEAAIRNFRGNLIFLISSGSFAYRGATKGKSDLDVMAVLDDNVRRIPQADLHNMTRGFIRDYVAIHQEYDYALDDIFPGEYVTPDNVDDAVAGRGISVSPEGRLYLPKASNQYYLGNQENYYRAWRSMLAFSKKLTGNEGRFQQAKLGAWETIVKYLLGSHNLQEISSDSLLQILTSQKDKWESVGVTDKYLTFCEDEQEYIERVLVRLKIKGILRHAENGYEVATDSLATWQNELVTRIASGDIATSDFLFSDKEDAEFAGYTKEAKRIESTSDIGKFERKRYSAAPMINRHLGECIQVVYSADGEECEKNGLTDSNILIFVKTPDPKIKPANGKLFDGEMFAGSEVLLRISSSCLHGSLGDTECPCYDDTINALEEIQRNESGIFIYMPQDAQGRGLRDKVRDHRLMYGINESGEAAQTRNLEESMTEVHPEGYDIRHYHIIAKIFEDLGLGGMEFTLLGTNKGKVEKLRDEAGIAITQTRKITDRHLVTNQSKSHSTNHGSRVDSQVGLRLLAKRA